VSVWGLIFRRGTHVFLRNYRKENEKEKEKRRRKENEKTVLDLSVIL